MVVMRLLFFVILSFSLFGQKSKFDTVFCDCEIAREIKLAGNKKVGVTIPPPGPGLKNEISHSKNKSQFVFEREHHSAWYELLIGLYTTTLMSVFLLHDKKNSVRKRYIICKRTIFYYQVI